MDTPKTLFYTTLFGTPLAASRGFPAARLAEGLMEQERRVVVGTNEKPFLNTHTVGPETAPLWAAAYRQLADDLDAYAAEAAKPPCDGPTYTMDATPHRPILTGSLEPDDNPPAEPSAGMEAM
ncbi:hypothetical protein HQ590_08620 [bacterium]|nr:hypothetical protein [bacterium]